VSRLHTSTASIAAALRRAADDVDKAGDVQLSPVVLQLNLQAVNYHGTPAERKATVDTLAAALTGRIGETEEGRDAQHRLESFTPRTGDDDMDVAIYTAVEDFGSRP